MHIHSLTLENVKSYADGTITFAQGTNAIVGHNGAGKSTILEAIGFALFDHIGYNQADFVREGAKSATVTVNFVSALDEREYQAIRRCGSSSSHVIFDPALNQKICEGKADVLIFLRQHLGAEPTANLGDLFTNAVGVPQGTLTAAFLGTPSARKGIFDPLLRVEEYRKAYENLREPGRLLTQRQSSLDVTISGLEGRLERLPQLEAQADRLAQEIAAGQSELARTTAQLAAVQERRAGMEAQRTAIAALRAAVQQARQQVEINQRQAESARRRLAEAEQAQAAVERSRPGHLAYQAALDEKEELDAQSRSRQKLRDQLAALDKQLSLAQAELTRQQSALGEIVQAEATAAGLADAAAEQERLEDALRQAEQQAARLTDAQRQHAQAQTDCAQAETQAAQLAEKSAQAQTVEKALAVTERDVTNRQTELAAQQTQLARQQAEGDSLRQQIAALQQADGALCPVCEEPLTDEHRTDLLARNNQRLNELEDARKAVQNAIAAAEQSLRQAQAEVKNQQAALRRLPRADELRAAEERLAAVRNSLSDAEKLQSELSSAPGQAEAVRAQLAALGNPRQQGDFAAQIAARRPQVETALARQQKILAESEAGAAAVQSQLTGFAGLDEAQNRVAEAIAHNREADDLYRRNEQSAAGLLGRQREAADGETLLAAAQERLAKSTQGLAAQEAGFDEAVYREVAGEEQSLRNRQGSLEGQLAERERQRGEISQEVAELVRHQEELDAALAARTRLQEQAELLETLRRILREAGPYVTKALVQQISYGAGQLFSEIMQDHSRHLRWDEEYGIVLEVDGRDRQFAQLSGGEQMAAALSVRLALLREMSDIQVAFFDEPTSNLDEARRESLARQILSIEGFHQLFVISHDDTFEQATENLVRVQKVNGVSVVNSRVPLALT
ncbi:MAG: SMC family ATPase [Chloroflexi bacterium]|nr:SMC family ATPase [Chloroflexota bacterium]